MPPGTPGRYPGSAGPAPPADRSTVAFWRRRDRRSRPFDKRDLPRAARATVAGALEEGRLLADYAVRLQLKNRIEVATLGEDRSFAAEAFTEPAAVELRHIADEQDAVAERLEAEASSLAAKRNPRHVHDYHAGDRRNLRHRARVARALAEDRRAQADDHDALLALVERARQDAWRDIAHAIEAVIDIGVAPPKRPSAKRTRRIADFAEELAGLAALRELEHPVDESANDPDPAPGA